MNLLLFSNISSIDVLAEDFQWLRLSFRSNKDGIRFDDSSGNISDCFIQLNKFKVFFFAFDNLFRPFSDSLFEFAITLK